MGAPAKVEEETESTDGEDEVRRYLQCLACFFSTLLFLQVWVGSKLDPFIWAGVLAGESCNACTHAKYKFSLYACIKRQELTFPWRVTNTAHVLCTS